jgi:predicted DNA-binding protein (MmcQ/YjbR family)
VKPIEALRRLSGELPGAEEYVMVHHPAFRVGKKPFAIDGMDEAEKGPTLSINLGREAQSELLSDRRFAKTPYIGQHGWVTIVYAALKKGEFEQLVTESWRRVASKKQLAQFRSDSTRATPRL